MLRVATDIGGTFTDLVYVTPDGEVGTAKSHTTPGAVRKGRDGRHRGQPHLAERVRLLRARHDGRHQRHHREEGRQGRAAHHARASATSWRSAAATAPISSTWSTASRSPSCPRYLRREVPGRINYKGIETASRSTSPACRRSSTISAPKASRRSPSAFSTPTPTRPTRRQRWPGCKELWPEVSVVASHQITREWREYERTNTAVLSAYVQPIAHRYLDRLTGCPVRGRHALHALHHAVQLRRGHGQERAPDPDHDDRVGPRQRHLGRCGPGPADRRAGRHRHRHRRHDGQVRADHRRRGQAQHQLPGRAQRDLGRLPGDGAGGRPGGDRQRRRIDRLGGRVPAAARRPAERRRRARAGVLWRSAAPKRRLPTPTWRWAASTRTISAAARMQRRHGGRGHAPGQAGRHPPDQPPRKRRAASSASPTTTWSTPSS